MDPDICNHPSCSNNEDIQTCADCQPISYFCGDCLDNHECTTYSKDNPCPLNFRCGSETCYKEFYTPCDDCRPSTYWCEDCFKIHKCSKTDSDIENEGDDENCDVNTNNPSDILKYSCPICNFSWAYCNDPGSCENCAEINVDTESSIKYERSLVTENNVLVESSKKYVNSSLNGG